MPRATLTDRRTRPVVGHVRPEDRYDKNGVMLAAGIGEEKLSDAIKAGIVKPWFVGQRLWFDGADIIALIDSHK